MTYNPVVKGKRLVQAIHQDITLMAKKEKSTGHARVQWASRDPHPMGKQRPSPGGQRPSPTRAPIYTSRRAGISQGNLLHTRKTPTTLRMQGDHKEQHSSHSLNRWKERFALWHRHAGMSTGSEPYTLRTILDKGVQALMTRLGPSHEEGPRTQSHIRWTPNMTLSEFYHMYVIWYCQGYCPILHILQRVSYREDKQCYNVINREDDKSMIGAVAQCYQYNKFYQGECSYWQGNGPMLFVYIMWPPWKETISHFCDTLEMWILSNFGRNQRTQRNQLSILRNFSYPSPYPETSLTLGTPR